MSVTFRTAVAALVGAAALLAGCERPPVEVVQHGYRGTGMELVYNPRTVAAELPIHQAPEYAPLTPNEGPKARDVYQNVKVLGDLSVANFNRHMATITQWVAPKEGCNYCHNAQNFADDGKYTKVVARRMIEMTQHVNANWTQHVAQTGVTCYTCHRGNPVPSNVWFAPLAQDKKSDFIGDLAEQNQAAKSVGLASLPYDPFSHYLKDAKAIRVATPAALPGTNRSSIQQTEFTYSLMMHFSKSLGVNCNFCHNSRSFGEWEQAAPQRVTAWHGIRMARDLNNDYLEPLTGVFPAQRLGPMGDVAKVNCATCHQGAYKPLFGKAMAKDFPELLGVKAVAGLPAPLVEAMRSTLFFDVGSAALQGEQAKGLAQLIDTMSASKASKVSISGYHSAAGELTANQELAKQRAFAVRDALLAAGIPQSRVVLEKPVQAAANIAGEDPAARKVEVTVRP